MLIQVSYSFTDNMFYETHDSKQKIKNLRSILLLDLP